MSLPKIEQPLFEVKIPSTGERAHFRPFTVKEEKILLIAKESKDINQIALSTKQVLNNCLSDVRVESLALFDVEYLLLQIRGKSVNNEIEFKVKDEETDAYVDIVIDIDTISIKHNPEHKKLIEVTPKINILMKYPSLDMIELFIKAKNDSESSLFDIVSTCIDQVTDGDNVYKLSDFTEAEVQEFVDSLSSPIMLEIQDFFKTMPVLRIEHEYTNSKGNKKKFVAQGLETFFT